LLGKTCKVLETKEVNLLEKLSFNFIANSYNLNINFALLYIKNKLLMGWILSTLFIISLFAGIFQASKENDNLTKGM
jgi:hypothetical protein